MTHFTNAQSAGSVLMPSQARPEIHGRTRLLPASGVLKRTNLPNWLPMICLTLLALILCGARSAPAQSPNYVIEGPTIIHQACPNCITTWGYPKASITYPSGSSITQNRVVVVPRGNLQFEVPVSSAEAATPATPNLQITFTVTVTATGPNGVGSTSNSASTVISGIGAAKLEIPIPVDWSESIVTMQIGIERAYSGKTTCIKGGCTTTASDLFQDYTGPNLSSIPLGLSYNQAFTPDAFLVVVTPAAAFQLPVLPIAILYSPLGNVAGGGGAKSSLAFAITAGQNQQFTTSKGATIGYTQDDKTTYQDGVTLGMSFGKDAFVDPTKVSMGYTASGSWDNSVEDSTANLSTTATSVTDFDLKTVLLSDSAASGQPPVNQIGYYTQPFWNDQILAVTSAQFALWDYPNGPVVQPLGSAAVVELPIRTLDNCINTPAAVEPTTLTPVTWEPGQTYAVGTLVVGNDIAGNPAGPRYVVTTAGTTGSAQPNWNATFGATNSDGTVVWTNESSHVLPKPVAPPATTPEYLWLDWQDCTNIADLDQFYLKKAQSVYPLSYDPSFTSSLSANPGSVVSNLQSSLTTITQANSTQFTSKVSSVVSNSEGVSASITSLLGLFGVNLADSTTSTATATYTSVSAIAGQHQQTVGGSVTATTFVDDSYTGQFDYNIVQDLIFDGMAVEVPGMNPPKPMPINPIHNPFPLASLESAKPLSEPGANLQVDYTVLKPESDFDPATWAEAHEAAASRHEDRPIPDPAPGYAVPWKVN